MFFERKMNKKKLLLYGLWFVSVSLIVYFWFQNSFSLFSQGKANVLIAVARLCGLLAVFCSLTQLLLIGRVAWIERIFGHDKLSIAHHLNGLLTWIFIFMHPLLMISGYALSDKTTFFNQIVLFVTSDFNFLKAVLAFILFMVIIFTSINLMRKKLKYEFWWYLHLCTYVAILLAFGHQLKFGGDLVNRAFLSFWYFLYFFAFGNLFFFRVLTPLYVSKKQQYKITRIIPENASVTSIFITGNDLKKLKIKPGQFMIFHFLQKGFWFEAHPFSISKVEGNELRISVKAVGDFTKRINELKVGTKVIIEGPYGRFIQEKKEKFLLVAAGIGITPIKALSESLVAQKKDVVLIYANSNKEDIVFKKELDNLEKEGCKIIYTVTSDPSWIKEKRRVDKEFLKEYVSDVKEREIYLCGPPPFMNGLKKELNKEGIKNIHFEKFSLG